MRTRKTRAWRSEPPARLQRRTARASGPFFVAGGGWVVCGGGGLPRCARYPRVAWIYGGTSRVIGGAVWTRINRRSTPCVDALRCGAMNPVGLLRPGVNVGRFGCAVVAGLRRALPRCARYPRMAWIYGVFSVADHCWGRIHAWRGSTGFFRRGSLLGRYPRMAWIYGVFTSRIIAGAVSTHGVDLRFFTSRSLACIHRGTPRATSHGRGRCVRPRRSFGARVGRFRC